MNVKTNIITKTKAIQIINDEIEFIRSHRVDDEVRRLMNGARVQTLKAVRQKISEASCEEAPDELS
jgi:hypothetical protein